MTDHELSRWLLDNAGPGVGREAQRKLDDIWWGPASERRRRLETWRDFVLRVTPGLTHPEARPATTDSEALGDTLERMIRDNGQRHTLNDVLAEHGITRAELRDDPEDDTQ